MAAATSCACSADGRRAVRRFRRSVTAAIALCALTGAAGALAQDAIGQGQYGPSVVPLQRTATGQRIATVEVEIAASSGSDATDAAALAKARAAVAALVGRSYQPVLADTILRPLVADGTIRSIAQTPDFDPVQGGLTLRLALSLAPEAAPAAPAAKVAFPLIHQDDRSKLTFIIGGGSGVYSDSGTWFGDPLLFNASNPLAGNLPGRSTTWPEAYLELGIGGATQIGDLPLYAYGAVSGIFSLSRGQDIFTDTDRDFFQVEKGYAGLLYADKETGNSAQLSFGRQSWTLNNGFLISMISGSSNAGERGATYLGPRNATDFSALATGQFGKASFALFYIDPNELEDLESNTTFGGMNLGYKLTDAFSLDASYISIPTSDSTYRAPGGVSLPRQGTSTYGLHGLYRPAGEDHLWVEAEAYHQTNSNFDMSANAWYGTLGYIRKSAPWSPSISIRYASFSGDDPETPTFERFDSLMSTGFGNWLQGMSFGKVYRNANLNTLRVQVNLVPRENMNLTLDWHKLRADELNNLGANPALSSLSSRDIGDEFGATLRWAINRNYYLQLVASHALPGRALKSIGADKPWTSVQASLYVNF